MKKTIITIILFINSILTLHLNLQQKHLINNILKNPNTTLKQRQYIHRILYKSYEKLAIKKAMDFKKQHYYKCKDINNEELIFYSKIGLWKSIISFKGYIFLDKFSPIYIKHELYEYLNDKYASSILPKSLRKKSKKTLSEDEKIKHNYLLNNYFYSYNWQLDNLKTNSDTNFNTNLKQIILQEEYNHIWYKINNSTEIDNNTKKILHLKYDYNFNKIKSNKKIAEIMGYSEEYVRKKHNKLIHTLFHMNFRN